MDILNLAFFSIRHQKTYASVGQSNLWQFLTLFAVPWKVFFTRFVGCGYFRSTSIFCQMLREFDRPISFQVRWPIMVVRSVLQCHLRISTRTCEALFVVQGKVTRVRFHLAHSPCFVVDWTCYITARVKVHP